MNKYQHPDCNDVLGAPSGVSFDQCNALPIQRAVLDSGQDCVVSFWKPTIEELSLINKGHAIRLIIWGRTHAPLLLDVADAS